MPRFKEGDRVRVKGTPHMEGHTVGVVKEVSDETPYAIRFDGTSADHKWYVDSELEPEGSGERDSKSKQEKKPMRMERGGQAVSAIASELWAISSPEHWLSTMAAIAQRSNLDPGAAEAARRLRAEEFSIMAGPSARRLEGARYAMVSQDGVAILPVFGPIFPRANLMTEVSGATSAGALLNDYRLALSNPDVGAIMLLMDTPGGAVSGINAVHDAIAPGRKQKPTKAYVTGTAASAGYWIASAVGPGNIVMDRTSIVGSIGVVAAIPKQVEPGADGVMAVEIVSANAPNKRPDPTTEEGADTIRATLNAIETQFIADVAKGRGVSVEKVKSDFGKGGVLVGQDAVSAGMADKIMSYDAAFNELAAMVRNKRRADALRK
ncbi:MAG: S49 family peptidase [Alphaproteobacteria bacterium]